MFLLSVIYISRLPRTTTCLRDTKLGCFDFRDKIFLLLSFDFYFKIKMRLIFAIYLTAVAITTGENFPVVVSHNVIARES